MTWARRLLIGFGFALCLVLLGESWARGSDWLWYGAPLLSNPSQADLTMADAGRLRGRPEGRFERWRLNRQGLQGPDFASPRPSGMFRVVVLGASEMFGLYESRGMSAAEQLQRLLAARVPERVEVLNAALAGFSLPRTTEFCRSQLAALEPSVVIYYANPVTYLAEDRPPQAFRPPPAPSEAPKSRFGPRLLLLLNRAVPHELQEIRSESGSARFLERQRAAHAAGWVFRSVPEERVVAFEEDLLQLLSAMPEGGLRLVLTSHAHRYHDPLTRADERHIVGWQAFYPRADADALLGMERAANACVRRVATQNGAAFADVAGRVPAEARYFGDFTHFTDEGAALAAKAMADVIAPATLSASVRRGR